MASSLKGKVIAITGAASGIGRVTALILAHHGVLPSLADVNKAALAKVAEEARRKQPAKDTTVNKVLTTAVDVRNQQDCNNWIAATVAHFGQPIVGAANLAGVFGRSIGSHPGSVRNITDDEFDWVMAVNTKGVLNCLRAQLPSMQTGSQDRGGGSIVNASSGAGLVGVPFNAPYVASKHAVSGITRTAAKEEGPTTGIRVNAVAPGLIATPMTKQIEEAVGTAELLGAGQGDPGVLKRRGDPEKVAELIIFLLSPQSGFVTGAVYSVDGWWTCLLDGPDFKVDLVRTPDSRLRSPTPSSATRPAPRYQDNLSIAYTYTL
ncbi:NAD(P)-binding domain protein, partial [Metarhizium majus ARSEF 297]